MSDLKMLCPSCESSTTAIRSAAEDGEPCPYCGRVLPEYSGRWTDPTPLVTASRDALAEVLRSHMGHRGCDCTWDSQGDRCLATQTKQAEAAADALLASGVVRAVDGLADDEALVEVMAQAEYGDDTDGAPVVAWGETSDLARGVWRAGIRVALRALAAALATPTDPSEA